MLEIIEKGLDKKVKVKDPKDRLLGLTSISHNESDYINVLYETIKLHDKTGQCRGTEYWKYFWGKMNKAKLRQNIKLLHKLYKNTSKSGLNDPIHVLDLKNISKSIDLDKIEEEYGKEIRESLCYKSGKVLRYYRLNDNEGAEKCAVSKLLKIKKVPVKILEICIDE